MLKYPYPPRGFDWQIWTCPIVFAGLMLITVALLLRRRTSKSVRTIGIVCVGAATFWFLLMLPKFQGAAEAAPRTDCRINLNKLITGVLEYHEEHERLPEPTTVTEGGPRVSWRVSLLPYLGREMLGAGYDTSKAWDDTANQVVALREPEEIYRCLSSHTPQDGSGRWYTAYALLTGPDTAFPVEGPRTLSEITDGKSETLLIVEACGRNIVWTEPRDVDVSKETDEINAPGAVDGSSDGILSSWHRGGGATCAMADGSVRFLSQNTSSDVLRALSTAAAKDDPGEF